MTRGEILTRLSAVFSTTFNMPNLQISDTTRKDDIPDWDSLANIRLLMAVEKELGIKFSTRDIASIRDLPDLIEAIAKRQA